MSNQAVGNVYQAIIDEVVNSSRVDFEESGIEESVLEELRQGWQRKLSQLDVARFPWDPKPEPPPQQAAQPIPAPQVPAQGQVQAQHSQAQFSPQLPQGLSLPIPQVQTPHNNGVKTEAGYIKQEPGVAIKQEPGVSANPMPPYAAYGGMENKNSNVAVQRAAQQLQAQYGQRAASSINALQQQQQQQQQQQHQQPQLPVQQQPQHPQQQQHPNPQTMTVQQQQAYRQQMAATTQQQRAALAAANGQNHMRNGQTDGAGDNEFEGVLMERGATGDLRELGRVEIDRMLHEQIAARARAMEGGGLMLPLREATQGSTAAASGSRRARQPGAFDGGDEDDIDDEDAINSDLDDPDEDRDDDEVDDEGLGHIMLCMYDKVQRVKNKWKCTLKDGVLTVNGKEYVFHKATGEYEW